MFWPLWWDTNTHMNTIWYLKIKRKWCKALYILFIIVITTAFWSTLLALIYIHFWVIHAFTLWTYRSWYYCVVFIWVHALTQTVSLTIHKIKLLKGGICRYTNYCACTIYMYQVNFCSICHCTSKYLHAMLSFYVTICLNPVRSSRYTMGYGYLKPSTYSMFTKSMAACNKPWLRSSDKMWTRGIRCRCVLYLDVF